MIIPEDYPWVSNQTIYEWRQLLKLELLNERQWRSDFSGKPLKGQCDMHEGIISRAVVPKSVEWHFRIFHPYNCFLLLPEEHRYSPPSRAWAISRAFERYGEETIREWFYSLPWKSVPFRI